MPAGCSRFIGYSENQILRSFDGVEVMPVGVRPQIERHRDLFGFPDVDALYDANGDIVPPTQMQFIPPETRTSSAERAIAKYRKYLPAHRFHDGPYNIVDRPVVLLGHVSLHWGHFLFESLSRMWAWLSGEVDLTETLPLFTSRRPFARFERLPFVREIMPALGLPLDRIAHIERPTLFRDVTVVHPSVNYSFRMFTDHAQAHSKIAATIGRPSRRFDFPVFISREGVTGTKTFVGEDAVVKEMTRRGFVSIRPETLTVADQIALFSQSPAIFGSLGSAFHNMLFEPPAGDRIRVMMAPPRINGRYLMVDQITSGHTTWYLNVASQSRHRGDTSAIDVNQTIALLEQTPLREFKCA